MRISVIGANGQLGRDLVNQLTGNEVTSFTRTDFDVTDHRRARLALTSAQPDMIVNLTAYHRVDDCETNAELAYAVNAVGVLNLVRIANDVNATMVQFSTDYVFDGESSVPYTEESRPFPLSVYGNSRLAGEYLVQTESRRYLLIRTCGLYGKAGSQGKDGNFVETMLQKARRGDVLRVVNDQTVTPTSTLDLARQLALLVKTSYHGLFHVTNEGSCSWYDFARAIFEIRGIEADLEATDSKNYVTPARRPHYSVLENKRLKDLGINRMLPWRDALVEYLA